MQVDLTRIPEELKKYPNWVNWIFEEREGKLTKPPINSKTDEYADSTDPSTWSTFLLAVKHYRECENDRIQGIGFVPTNGYVGVDLDHCRNPETGLIESWAQEIISELKSYTEVTPSGAGVRVWVKGSLPEYGRKKGNIEMYAEGRFFTVTGQHLKRTPLDIYHREEELKTIHRKIFGNGQKAKTDSKPKTSLSLSDADLIKKAGGAKNTDKFRLLWEGDWKGAGYPSPSEADLALCLLLSFWTVRDAARIDALFRQSGLMREKWDERHFGDGRTYGQQTIEKAIQGTTETYTGPQKYDKNVTHEKQAPTEKEKPRELSYLTLNLPSSLEISKMNIDVDWVVKNLIPKESITLLHSIGGVGKSYLMYGIAKAVADGEFFFGLDVIRIPVYYIDFENPLPEIVDRMKKMGGSENLRIWHLGHEPMPIRFDADEWEVYKTFPPGLFIIDSLRSSHLLEENSSKDASFIMARHKEIRASGSTIILIHHENKVGGYRGSTAWFDLSDHILKFSRVKKIGSDEDAEGDDFDLPIRLGLGGKSRFSSAMDLRPMYFKFEDHLLCRADDPDDETLEKMAGLLDPKNPPCRKEFETLVKDNLGFNRKVFDRLLKAGEKRNLWIGRKVGERNKLGFFRVKNDDFNMFK
jgi:putative DNA primase/helicase